MASTFEKGQIIENGLNTHNTLSKIRKLMAPVIAALAIAGCTTNPAPGGNGNTTTTQPGVEMLSPDDADKVYITGCDSNTTGSYSLLNNQPFSYSNGLENRGAREVVKAAVNGSAISTFTPTLAEQAVIDEINDGEDPENIRVISQCVTNAAVTSLTAPEITQLNTAMATNLENLGVDVVFLETPPIQPGTLPEQTNPGVNDKISQVNEILEASAETEQYDFVDYPYAYGYADPIHIGPTTQNSIAANLVSFLNQQP
ncbi:MAG: hypothetical protein U0451_00690 [Candidatus Saccharimonadales bacterium]